MIQYPSSVSNYFDPVDKSAHNSVILPSLKNMQFWICHDIKNTFYFYELFVKSVVFVMLSYKIKLSPFWNGDR